MAACSLGASTVKFSDFSLRLSGIKFGTLQPPCSLTTRTGVSYGSLMVTRRLGKELIECKCLSNEEQAAANSESDSEEAKCSATTSPLMPTSYEVESLLTQICDTTSIAEFELKFGGFMLNVRRNLAEGSTPSFPPVSASVNMNTTVEAPDLNGCVTTPSLAISKPVPPSGGIQTLLDKAADEGLAILQSPRVGCFRRSRTIKGKRAPPSCKEKQIVKEGQVLCYIEQLGGEIPVESDTSGEVIKILREDGEPVGYGDALIAILPSFPGIKKLQ